MTSSTRSSSARSQCRQPLLRPVVRIGSWAVVGMLGIWACGGKGDRDPRDSQDDSLVDSGCAHLEFSDYSYESSLRSFWVEVECTDASYDIEARAEMQREAAGRGCEDAFFHEYDGCLAQSCIDHLQSQVDAIRAGSASCEDYTPSSVCYAIDDLIREHCLEWTDDGQR